MFTALICLVGAAVLVGLAFLFSLDRKRINWRTVLLALAMQAGVGALVLYVPMGQAVLAAMTTGVSAILDYAKDGIVFVFGEVGSGKLGFVFAFQVLPAIIFFSSLISVLYYTGVMRWVVMVIGGLFRSVLRISAPESLSAAANIFMGQTEAPIAVRPFLVQMSRSELFAVMVGGLATVAGATMAGYAALGVELKYLIAASFMAAPGGIAMAKIFVPEQPDAKLINDVGELGSSEEDPANIFDAAAKGATSGLMLAANVGAMLIAFIALIALANGLFGWVGGLAGFPQLSLELVLGYLFAPIAFLIGVPWAEAVQAGSFIGQKLVLNEFVAYVNLVSDGANLSAHTTAVVTFALCGFANFSSIAILLGGIGSMAPERRPEIAQLGVRALLAASLANLMSAAIASFFLLLGS
ncbi:MAG: NupC/NupG family nucleoside CNT transporter [Pseudomonadales bacterium]|jgi:CNT family concentrative nucleoside transporter|nr:NupC/NupG family nucleoside CNT transporter [Pseudomonadales bacterium]